MMVAFANIRLYLHALALFAWAAVFAMFDIAPTTFVVVVMLVTVGVAAVLAERERSRKRHGSPTG